MPEKVKELDALIDEFIADTGALVPKPNPAFKPQAAKAAMAGDAGLVARVCTMEVKDGMLHLTGPAGKRNAFLGTAQVKYGSPMKLKLRVRSPSGGPGLGHWKAAKQEDFPEDKQQGAFGIPAAADWQDVAVDLPVDEPTSTVRLYVPTNQGPIDLQVIEYSDAKSGKRVRAWDFQ